MTAAVASTPRRPYDRLLHGIARYAARAVARDAGAYAMARYCLMDALGCACQALGVNTTSATRTGAASTCR